jgi:hypothetical protein
MVRDFQALFCERFACSAEEFEELLFWRCLYRHALPLAAVLRRTQPTFFTEDFSFLRELRRVNSTSEVVGELNRFYGRNVRDRSWLRKSCHIRVSGKRVLRLYRTLARQEHHRSFQDWGAG